jgi:Auxiliary Activity family 9 (formerly GH61)
VGTRSHARRDETCRPVSQFQPHLFCLIFSSMYRYMSPEPQRIVRKVPWNGEYPDSSYPSAPVSRTLLTILRLYRFMIGPVQDVTILDLQCNGYTAGGVPPAPAPLLGTIPAGANITFHWTSWPDNHKGPVITYMARVPDD